MLRTIIVIFCLLLLQISRVDAQTKSILCKDSETLCYGSCISKDSICLNVPIGGVTQVDNFGYYFQLWYSFAIGAVGVLATVMIMWGGFKWLTSRGNSGTISESKQIIWSAIIGVVLAFLSYTILYLINPRLTTIGLPTLQTTQITVLGSLRIANPAAITGTTNTMQAKPTGGTDAPGVSCAEGNYSRAYTVSYEGYRDTAYWDVDGWSIGYGHHYPPGSPKPEPITEAEGRRLFEEDYSASVEVARNEFSNNWNQMSQAQQAVLIDLVYNMGGGVFNEFTTMTRRIHENDYAGAAEALLQSRYAQQLPNRAANNAEILGENNFDLYRTQAENNCFE